MTVLITAGASTRALYETEFSITARDIGRKTIDASISRPFAENRILFMKNCPASGAYSLAWQGVGQIKRVRVVHAVAVA